MVVVVDLAVELKQLAVVVATTVVAPVVVDLAAELKQLAVVVVTTDVLLAVDQAAELN